MNPKMPIAAAVLAVVFAFLLASSASAQYVTNVVQFSPGAGSGFYNPLNIIGPPAGGGFNSGGLEVVSLGTGGEIIVEFQGSIVDGPGVDFTVFENGFEFPANFMFTELAHVEVSTDGFSFARFPSFYQGPQGPFPTFTTFPYGSSMNLAGSMPVIANPLMNTVSPLNPVFSGGDCFDLSDLQNDPLVTSGVVDLTEINFVKLVDVVEGVDADIFGNIIWDSTSSADIDGVAILNGTANSNAPSVEFSVDPWGYLHLTFSDPNGLSDLDGLSFMGSSNLVNFTPAQLFMAYDVFTVDSNSIDLRTKIPIVGLNLNLVVAAGIFDLSGNVCYDQFVLPR